MLGLKGCATTAQLYNGDFQGQSCLWLIFIYLFIYTYLTPSVSISESKVLVLQACAFQGDIFGLQRTFDGIWGTFIVGCSVIVLVSREWQPGVQLNTLRYIGQL